MWLIKIVTALRKMGGKSQKPGQKLRATPVKTPASANIQKAAAFAHHIHWGTISPNCEGSSLDFTTLFRVAIAFKIRLSCTEHTPAQI